MSILQRIVLRYSAPGHLRFAVPRELLTGRRGPELVAALGQHCGVYRVRLYPGQGKVSIRYFDGLADARGVATAFAKAARSVEQLTEASPNPGSGQELTAHNSPAQPGPVDWIRAKVREAGETVTAAGIVIRNVISPPGNSTERNKFVSEFFIDILVLYLIKAHWHLITQHWLKRPWQFRYEWTASIYMIYLLVRSKRPK